MKATVEVDVKNLDDVTKKLIRDLQRKLRNLETKFNRVVANRDSQILELDKELRGLESDKRSYDRIKDLVKRFAEEFGFEFEREEKW